MLQGDRRPVRTTTRCWTVADIRQPDMEAMSSEHNPGSGPVQSGSSHSSFRVGILGGGQLARMLVEAALPLGLEPVVFTDDPLSPAARICPWVQLGSVEDAAALEAFLSSVSVVAFENEFIDTERLRQAARGDSVRFEPGLETLHRLQNKLSQKQILESLGIPGAPYQVIQKGPGLDTGIAAVRAGFPEGCVFKWSRMGYDGKGVLLSGPETEAEVIHRFCEHGFSRPAEVYVEQKIRFRRELALVAARSCRGEFSSWPLVISEQEAGICRRVWGPATNFGVAPELEAQARQYAAKLAEALEMTGVFALEMFETVDGELLVNEIAPRVHNSGHYTQDGARTSQFSNHWRAILGLPLGPTDTPAAFAMLNLLGPAGVRLQKAPSPLPQPEPDIHLHWYDKAGIRPHRKLGHINRSAATAAEMAGILDSLEHYQHIWEQSLRKMA